MAEFNPERALARAQREFGEHGGVCPSIERSSTFTVIDPHTMPEIFEGIRGPESGGCFLYSRHFNPTVDVLGRYLAAMEATEAAMCTASGMAAISCTLLQLVDHGQHIVASNTVYGGTHALLDELLPHMGIDATFVDPDDSDAFEAAIRPETRVLYTEVLANPTLKVSDVGALADIAHRHDCTLVVDNTFSPVMVTPSRLGADVVIHSLTKFINGASDVIGGVICASDDFVHRLVDLHTGRVMLLGPTMDPRVAFDVMQRLPHLPIRMREHSRRAQAVAERLAELGASVAYPGLPDHPGHERLRGMLNPGYGFGGMLALDCGTIECAERTLAVLQNEEQFGLIAVSLGYFDTLMSCSGSSTSSEIAPEKQARMGLSPGLLRIAVGYTGDLDDRLGQIERALRTTGVIA
jgi:methionine-gamma-lyase